MLRVGIDSFNRIRKFDIDNVPCRWLFSDEVQGVVGTVILLLLEIDTGTEGSNVKLAAAALC